MKKLNKDNKGFSLVELLVVIAIMVVLVGVLAPTLLGNIEKSRVSSDIQVLDSVAGAIQSAIGGSEDAYTECMAVAGAVNTVAALYDGTLKAADGTSVSATHLASVVAEYLSESDIDFKGTEAKKYYAPKAATPNVTNLVFSVSASGRITVELYGATSGTALNAKDTNYTVTR